MKVLDLDHFGAVLSEVDLSEPLSADHAAAFIAAYERYHLLVAHDQHLDIEAQVRLMELLGPVRRDAHEGGASYVTKEAEFDGREYKGLIGDYPLSWHSDGTYVPCPTLALSLHALAIEGDTWTRFASGSRAFADMPTDLKTRLLDLQALHVRPHSMVTRNRLSDLEDFEPRQVRPVVGHDHHETGARAIWLNFQHTDSILGLDPDESEALIDDIFGRLYGPDNVYEHQWATGDLVVWDNLAVQHARDALGAAVTTRVLQRVGVETKTFEEQMFPGFTLTAVSDGGRMSESPDD